jgi:hypothetical protein
MTEKNLMSLAKLLRLAADSSDVNVKKALDQLAFAVNLSLSSQDQKDYLKGVKAVYQVDLMVSEYDDDGMLSYRKLELGWRADEITISWDEGQATCLTNCIKDKNYQDEKPQRLYI